MSLKCKWWDAGFCYSGMEGYKNANRIDGSCDGSYGCQVYKQWERDQDMLDTTTPAEAMQEIAHCKAVERKQRPVYSGVLKYFPNAIMEVANCSFVANEQHNPGEPMHWNRTKSADEHDSLVRHLMDAGTIDDDGIRHSTKVAWRALALLQK